MKYIITERQFKKISDLVLKEQTTTPSTIKPNSGVTINGISYKLPKINTQQELDKFTAPVQDQLVSIIDSGRMKGYTGMGPFTKTRNGISFGQKIILSIPELLRVNAMLGISKPLDLVTLQSQINSMSSQSPVLANLFLNSKQVLDTILTPNSDYAVASKPIFNYYKNLLNKRLL
jgi:hypothetical protein